MYAVMEVILSHSHFGLHPGFLWTMKLANTISSLILELISCPPQCKAFANLFTEPHSAFFFLQGLVSFSPLYAYLCWCLPSSPFMPSLGLGACSSYLELSYSAPPYCWLHLVFLWVCILPDLSQKSPVEAWQNALVHGQCTQRAVTHQKIP